MVLNLDVIACDELKNGASDFDLVSVFEHPLADALVIDIGSVGRAKIANDIVLALLCDAGMVT